ncbi:nicotinamide riboside transporter PnuC [Thermoflavimicrobium dichotomicum]|uniref:Nicotinamide mononucleotide transporter n=1 Tax=Thermoflavimicrobium dichotomicum TaxID=46223 RepID=A0A1I3SCZ9_9BACL|nr:nicotinamide riboside transporter PnuC [Thermoflavimicrobium dichotomicum]SFJ55479.1 nicotinamide mononucleotide transporter [Thermoflavimicrobium dichotomicum]
MKWLKDWTWFERIWLISFTLITLYLSYVWKDSLIGVISSLTGMLSVVLVAKGKISNYYFGIINVSLYAYLSYQQGFYGEVALNAFYFLPMQFYGLWVWRKKKVQNEAFDVKVAVMTKKEKWIWSIVTIVATLICGMILQLIKGNLPFIDAATMVLQMIAMWFMIKRFKEQWLLWILVDILSIGMWFHAFIKTGNDVSVLMMWAAYLFNAVYGYWNWNRAVKREVSV